MDCQLRRVFNLANATEKIDDADVYRYNSTTTGDMDVKFTWDVRLVTGLILDNRKVKNE